ncbi:hypothetical protein ACLOJK_027972 [Asimina triloba]
MARASGIDRAEIYLKRMARLTGGKVLVWLLLSIGAVVGSGIRVPDLRWDPKQPCVVHCNKEEDKCKEHHPSDMCDELWLQCLEKYCPALPRAKEH